MSFLIFCMMISSVNSSNTSSPIRKKNIFRQDAKKNGLKFNKIHLRPTGTKPATSQQAALKLVNSLTSHIRLRGNTNIFTISLPLKSPSEKNKLCGILLAQKYCTSLETSLQMSSFSASSIGKQYPFTGQSLSSS